MYAVERTEEGCSLIAKNAEKFGLNNIEIIHCLLYTSTPKVFVAGGAGTGILIYRELQRIGIAFTAGILYENDCDYPIAKALAADIVTEKMFEPIGKETLDKACKRIDEADYVIDTGCPIGSINSAMKELLDYAEKKNKRILTKPDIDTMKSLF